MANRKNEQDRDMNVAKGIKNAAGAAFHGAHNALEATENAAMNAVDATADAISDLTENENNNRKRNNR